MAKQKVQERGRTVISFLNPLHHLETFIYSENEFQLQSLCITPAVANKMLNGQAPWLQFTSKIFNI